MWSNQGCLKLAECNWLMCDDSNLMALVKVIYYGDWQQNRWKISRFHPLFMYVLFSITHSFQGNKTLQNCNKITNISYKATYLWFHNCKTFSHWNFLDYISLLRYRFRFLEPGARCSSCEKKSQNWLTLEYPINQTML